MPKLKAISKLILENEQLKDELLKYQQALTYIKSVVNIGSLEDNVVYCDKPECQIADLKKFLTKFVQEN